MLVVLLVAVGAGCILHHAQAEGPAPAAVAATTVTLPAPDLSHPMTLEQALAKRRSVRKYADAPVTLAQAGNLLWAAQGITEPNRGLRTAPSAMGMYPLHLYLVAGNVTDLPAGAYRYVPEGHKLALVAAGDQRDQVGTQPQMRLAPALLVYTADLTAMTARTHDAEKSLQWACVEAGHSAQNVLLEEVALSLIGVPMGGYNAATLKAALKLPDSEQLLYVLSAAHAG
jgi:SagB-type dehydrogenase family enzyme